MKDGSSRKAIYYSDIGDYKTKEEKIRIIEDAKSIENIKWHSITPDKNYDWINQRDINYDKYDSLLGDIFESKIDGVQTNRDAWVYNFSFDKVAYTGKTMVSNFNNEVLRLDGMDKNTKLENINTAGNFISWSRSLKKKLQVGKTITASNVIIKKAMYRPYVKKNLYYLKEILEYPRTFEDNFVNTDNLGILVSGIGTKRDFSTLIVDVIPDFNMLDAGVRAFFQKKKESDGNLELFLNTHNLKDEFMEKLGLDRRKTFYYIYGLLHSLEYRQKYTHDLRKGLPRIPISPHKEVIANIGEQLASLHLSYESLPVHHDINVIFRSEAPSYKVDKMKHPKKGKLDTIVFNNDIVIENIPLQAYDYIVNGKPVIQWIMEQYQVKVDKNSGIIDDPNLYSEDEKYIFNLLLSVINMSILTLDLMNEIPLLEV